MNSTKHIKQTAVFFCLFFCCLFAFSQQFELDNSDVFEIKGSVKSNNNNAPISGVQVFTENAQTITDGLGEFRIQVRFGDMLIIQSHEFNTVRYQIKDRQDIEVLVEDYEEDKKTSSKLNKRSKSIPIRHQTLLDSAVLYKETDIEKSIDFIAQSIAQLGQRGNKTELAKSLSKLGEIYQYHRQYDLAITNFQESLKAKETLDTQLFLANTYVLNKNFEKATTLFLKLVDKASPPEIQIDIYEGLGDAYIGVNTIQKAIDSYNKGLVIAQKNEIQSKITDMNSKIAQAYVKDNRLQEAQGYFANSLQLAKKEAPARAIQEKEKVADFYSQTNLFDEEIELRKNSLNELEQLSEPILEAPNSINEQDSITAQRINYKIANAYIAQEKLDEAIPFLEESIKEADADDDLIVQKDATRKLSEVFKYKGDFTKALETYQKYVTLVDTLYIRKEQEISRAARFNRDIVATQNRISGLEQERELSQSKYDLALTEQQLIQETNKRQKWIIYSLILGLLLMGLTIFFFYRNNKQQKLNNNLLALKSLRTQMNPHFIFNALNSVNNYIAKSDERSANRYLSDFSTLMRAVLENSEQDFIPLAKELQLLELYLKLEHSRFPEKFDYQIHLDEHIDIEAFKIPPMLLQPYIENAVWHGLRYKEEKGKLNVNLQLGNHENIVITIIDDGIGRKRSAVLKTQNQKKQKSKGMGNIKKRIAILNSMYKDKLDVSITDLNADGTGTKVVLNLKRNA